MARRMGWRTMAVVWLETPAGLSPWAAVAPRTPLVNRGSKFVKPGIMVLVQKRARDRRSGNDRRWHGPPGVTQPPARAGIDGLWIRESGLLPFPGLVVDHSVFMPFGVAGLGLRQVRRWRDLDGPLPTVSHLALDLSNQRAATISYLVHADDAELPLARGVFSDSHPVAWSAALAGGNQVLLTVAHCSRVLAARTPQEAARALDDAWTGIIGCGDDCVRRSVTSPTALCERHSRLHVIEGEN